MVQLRYLLWTHAGARGLRSWLSILAIALGVALGYGVHLVNRSAVDALTASVRSIAGDADLVVEGGRQGFDEQLYPKIARLGGVAAAAPAFEFQAGLAREPGVQPAASIRLIGVDPLRALRIQRRLFGARPGFGLRLLEPDTVLISGELARQQALHEGDLLRLRSGLGDVALRIVGVLPEDVLAGRAALTDISTAQWRFDRLGRLNRIDLRLAEGAAGDRIAQQIRALLPAGAQLTTGGALEGARIDPSRAYRANLNVLALVALFTGGFLVFSAQSLDVARRRNEHAVLRVLGLEQRGVVRLVLLEAGAIGLFGALLGLALGFALAHLVAGASGGDFGAGVFSGLSTRIAFSPVGALVYGVLGVAIALAGAVVPAIEAGRRPPAQALKVGDEQTLFRPLARAWPGLLLLALGGAFAFAGPVGGVPVFGYVSIACLLIGSITLMPRVVEMVLAAMPAPRQPVALLALEQLRGAPGQAMVSLAAIVASFSLMVAMAIMVSSFRDSVDVWLERVLPADLYFRTTHSGETGYVTPEFEAAVRALPQVVRAEFLRSARIRLIPGEPEASLIARDLNPGQAPPFPLVRGEVPSGAHRPAWISESIADRLRVAPGDAIDLPIGATAERFHVAGVWRDYARLHGAVVIRRDDYRAITGDPLANDAGLWLAPGASLAQARDALRALPGGEALDIADTGEIRSMSLRLFDRSFAITYGIEAIAVLVGLFGLSSSIGAIVLARRREFGMLRHLGMTRAQLGAMLAAEGGLLALLGAIAGSVVGGAISLVLIHVVNRQSFHWGMDLSLPWASLAGFTAALIALAVVTAWLSGREAMSMGPVRAVREDW